MNPVRFQHRATTVSALGLHSHYGLLQKICWTHGRNWRPCDNENPTKSLSITRLKGMLDPSISATLITTGRLGKGS